MLIAHPHRWRPNKNNCERSPQLRTSKSNKWWRIGCKFSRTDRWMTKPRCGLAGPCLTSPLFPRWLGLSGMTTAGNPLCNTVWLFLVRNPVFTRVVNFSTPSCSSMSHGICEYFFKTFASLRGLLKESQLHLFLKMQNFAVVLLCRTCWNLDNVLIRALCRID